MTRNFAARSFFSSPPRYHLNDRTVAFVPRRFPSSIQPPTSHYNADRSGIAAAAAAASNNQFGGTRGADYSQREAYHSEEPFQTLQTSAGGNHRVVTTRNMNSSSAVSDTLKFKLAKTNVSHGQQPKESFDSKGYGTTSQMIYRTAVAGSEVDKRETPSDSISSSRHENSGSRVSGSHHASISAFPTSYARGGSKITKGIYDSSQRTPIVPNNAAADQIVSVPYPPGLDHDTREESSFYDELAREQWTMASSRGKKPCQTSGQVLS